MFVLLAASQAGQAGKTLGIYVGFLVLTVRIHDDMSNMPSANAPARKLKTFTRPNQGSPSLSSCISIRIAQAREFV
jgi:hypothetical protein